MRRGHRGKMFGRLFGSGSSAFLTNAAFLANAVVLAGCLFVSGCKGGGGGDSPNSGMKITSVNLTDGAVWKINRQIRISFNAPVDFSSVTSNSINVRRIGGGPATVEFFLDPLDPNTVVLQPRCPTLDDLSDAGLLAGGDPANGGLPYAYELNIIGADNSTLPVRSTSGDALRVSDTRNFTTPTSLNPLDLFIDTKVGPPVARVIQATSVGGPPISDNDQTNSTYIEVLEDAATGQPKRYYFQRVAGTLHLVDLTTGALAPPLPLNKLSDPASQISLVIGFNQAVDPSSTNISDARLRWEYESAPGVWTPLQVSVVLEDNCTRSGAFVRVSPLGLLPPSTQMRAVITPQFVDIVGENNLLADDNFAVADTEMFPITPPELADHYLEDFDTNVNEDEDFLFPEPHATWGNGELTPTFSFSGNGGPGGSFDWVLPTGTIVIFNTSITTITGYQIFEDANGNFTGIDGPLNNQTSIGGVIDIDDLWIQNGAILKFEGPNAVQLLAKGTIRIDGSIVVNGTSTNGVTTLNTTNIPEPGAAGQAGGGKGGTGNPLTTASSPKGTAGFGAFNAPDGGGGGGETGWSTAPNLEKRRGAGGGGGRLGKDVPNPTTGSGAFDQRLIGLDAEKGFDNLLGDNGAISGAPGPFGGAAGPGPFIDSSTTNDFFGTMFDVVNQSLVAGELKKPWAGAGGGGGGSASRLTSGTFPGPFSSTGDEKGSGGGGGAGSLHVLALGDIVWGPSGQILCRGGLGGGGENTIFLNRVGGGSGAGSGGHVVLQSAKRIDFRLCDTSPRPIDTRGGQGGAGANDLGGATQSTNGQKESTPLQDACPPGYAISGPNPCRGQVDGAGGDGGPGIIQLHTTTGVVGNPSTPNADILLPAPIGPTQLTLKDLCAPPALCPGGALGNGALPADCFMIPTFGRKSRAVSEWVALGEGSFDINNPGVNRDVEFMFSGIDPATGLVQTVPVPQPQGPPIPKVVPQPPVLPPVTVQTLGLDDFSIVLDATAIVNTSYASNTKLLEHFLLQLSNDANANEFARFDVIDASYDASALPPTLTLQLDADGPKLTDAPVSSWALADVELQPAYFRVNSDDVEDVLPSTATVQIQFEATGVDANGNPDPATIIGPTSDISLLNAMPNGHLRFVRFQVLFDIANGVPLDPANPIPTLEFFRLKFRYQ